MQKSAALESRLLSSVLARISECYFHCPGVPPASALILIYLNNSFTDGIYWISTRLMRGILLSNATAYRLQCWDVHVTETGLVLEVLEAQFASSRIVGMGLITQIDHNPRVRDTLQRIRYLKVTEIAGKTTEVKAEREDSDDFVFPQYALDYLAHIYGVQK